MKKHARKSKKGTKRLLIGMILTLVGIFIIKLSLLIAIILIIIGAIFVLIGMGKLGKAKDILKKIEEKIECEKEIILNTKKKSNKRKKVNP